MKKKYLFIILIMMVSTLANSQNITNGLVGYWPFDGNTNDLSNNMNHGIINGAYLDMDRFNNPNSSYSFDGIDDHIVINHISQYEFGDGDFSYFLWIKRGDLGGRQDPLVKKTPSNTASFATYIPNNKLNIFLKGNGVIYDYQVALFDHLDWIHVGFTRESGVSKTYLNGEIVNTRNTVGNVSFDGPLYIGSNFNTNGLLHPFKGTVDEIYLYNRALSSSEVTQIYSNDTENSVCSSVYCDEGNVGIGTSDTRGFKLAIAGKTITEEIKISLVTNWPDYVFKANFDLLPLEELENYIKENEHLPEIPSEAEVTENGINLGEMDSKLLQKIEELTLYLIEQNKRLDAQQKEIELLKRKVKD